ncbi:matrix remodeling-associated protein 8-like isoform X1 [Mugil cephalus]|uniref:matrix remodeling-associated protein 8-like isoform X1 n=1 Tax=Mugil cephalus TaxID=48193 RepID=UPI001FB7E57E|nr:matrix remodeling-associated protein 8-like isoform X1 [Mugil cephalus]
MSTGTSASLWLTLLSVVLSVSGQINITAEPGQTVSLPCKALNNEPVTVVEWRRTDMKEDEYVLLYRDDQLDPENQNPSYKNRVDLQDRQMKDGDVSLILKDVTTDDSGTYTCHVHSKTNRWKRDADPITTIKLDVAPGQTNITAEHGQTVSLPCKALNNGSVSVVEWSRTDPKPEEELLLYRDEKLVTYKNRVDLQDRQMKDGDVSLILKDVTTDDSGTYECYINQREKNIIKKFLDPISIIRLDVVSSGHTSGHKEDGGDKEGGDKEGLSQGHLGLIVGVVVVVVSLVVAVSLITVRNRKKKSSPPSSPSLVPPVESSDHLLA